MLVTIEEGAIGGFGAYVMQALAEHGALDRGCRVRAWSCRTSLSIRMRRRRCMPRAGLDAKGIVTKVFEALGKDVTAETVRLA